MAGCGICNVGRRSGVCARAGATHGRAGENREARRHPRTRANVRRAGPRPSLRPRAAAARRRSGVRARVPPAAERDPRALGAGDPDPDHSRGRRRRRHAGRRFQPGARLRYRRRGRVGEVPRQHPGSQGCRRDVVDARRRPRIRCRCLAAGGVRHRLFPGAALGRRVDRTQANDALRAEGQDGGSGRPQAKAGRAAEALPFSVRAARDDEGRVALRGADPRGSEDRAAV